MPTKGALKILIPTTIWDVYFKSTVAFVTSSQDLGTSFMNAGNFLPAVFYQS